MGFVIQPNFYRTDTVEVIHRSLCVEAEINFIPLREIFGEFAGRNNIARHIFFDDSSHFKAPLIARFMSYVLNSLPALRPKTRYKSIPSDSFFTQDIKPFAMSSETYSTSLRKQEFGLFSAGMRIKLEEGCFLGFDFVTLNTEAFLRVNAQSQTFVKALHFEETRPWMKVAGFYSEVVTGLESFVEVIAHTQPVDVVETTEALATFERPLSGLANLSTFFYSTTPISNLAMRFRSSSRVTDSSLTKFCDGALSFMQGHRKEFIEILKAPRAVVQ